MPGNRGGGLNDILLGRFDLALLWLALGLALALLVEPLLNPFLHVQHQVDFGGWIKLEFLDHQFIVTGTAAPMNTVQAIAWLIIADTGNIWGDIMCSRAGFLATG